MGKKRGNRGRSKGSKGSSGLVQCASCGAMVPRDKAKKIYKRVSWIDSSLARELRHQHVQLPGGQEPIYYCISCSVQRGYYSPRAKDERTRPFRKRKR